MPGQGRNAAPQQLNQFTLNFQIRRTTPEAVAGKPPATKTAAKGGKA